MLQAVAVKFITSWNFSNHESSEGREELTDS